MSELAVASRLPSGLQATLVKKLVWPRRVSNSCPLAASHTFAVWSPLAVASRLPSGLQATLVKLSDVLEVETEVSQVRGAIERMEGERRLMAKQVGYATLTATVTEEYKAPASALPDSTATRFRNAAVDGYRSVVNFIIGVALFLISDGPMLVVWTLILLLPARWAWRRYRKYRETPSL